MDRDFKHRYGIHTVLFKAVHPKTNHVFSCFLTGQDSLKLISIVQNFFQFV